MVKSFLIIIICKIFLFAGEQIILVVADDFNSQKATLSCFENGKKVFDSFEVNMGKNGLAYGLGEVELLHNSQDLIKQEGDNRSPIGIFTLDSAFGYKQEMDIKMPYLYASRELICVDDPNSNLYNKIVEMPKKAPKSFELMRRDDNQYALGIVVGHNKEQLSGAGSCIFLHIKSPDETPTAGCTSMKYLEIEQIVHWLDKSKNPTLIQIVRSQREEILKLYPDLDI